MHSKHHYRVTSFLVFCLSIISVDAAFDRALEFNDDNPYVAFIAYTWKGHLSDLASHRDEALESYKKALQGYPGAPVTHSQFNMKIDKKWLEERLEKPFKR